MPCTTPSHKTVRASTRVLRYPDGTFAAQNTDLWSPVLAMKEAEEKSKVETAQPAQPTKPAQPITPEGKEPGIPGRTWDSYVPVAKAIPAANQPR